MAKGGWTLRDELLVKYGNPKYDEGLAAGLDRSLGAIKHKRTMIRNWERNFKRPYETLHGSSGTSQPVDRGSTTS